MGQALFRGRPGAFWREGLIWVENGLLPLKRNRILREGKILFLSTLGEKGFARGKEDIPLLSPSLG